MNLFAFIAGSVRTKVMAVVLATTVVALLVNAIALLAYEANAYRGARIAELQAQVGILGRAAAPALAFNDRKEADARGAALQAMLAPVRDLDWRVLLAMQGDASAGTMISSAFDQIARNVDKIGQLNITPDLLQSLLPKDSRDGAPPPKPRADRR